MYRTGTSPPSKMSWVQNKGDIKMDQNSEGWVRFEGPGEAG